MPTCDVCGTGLVLKEAPFTYRQHRYGDFDNISGGTKHVGFPSYLDYERSGPARWVCPNSDNHDRIINEKRQKEQVESEVRRQLQMADSRKIDAFDLPIKNKVLNFLNGCLQQIKGEEQRVRGISESKHYGTLTVKFANLNTTDEITRYGGEVYSVYEVYFAPCYWHPYVYETKRFAVPYGEQLDTDTSKQINSWRSCRHNFYDVESFEKEITELFKKVQWAKDNFFFYL